MASEAFVRVVADTSGVEIQIEREVSAAVRAAERSIPEIDVEVNVDTDRARGELDEFGGSISRITPQFSGLLGAVGPLGAALGAVAASGVAAGAALAAIPLLFGGIGVVAAAQSEEVQKAFTGLKDHVVSEVTAMAGPVEDVLVRLAKDFTQTFDTIAPSLEKGIAQSAPLIEDLGNAFGDMLEAIVPALADLVTAATPAFNALAKGVADLGPGLADFFKGLSLGALGGADALEGVFDIVNALLKVLGPLLGALAQFGGPVLKAVGDALLVVVAALQPLFPILAEVAGVLAEAVVPIIGTLGNVLAMLLPPVIELIGVLVTALMPIFTQLVPLITPLLSLLTGIAGIFVQIASEVIGALIPALMPLIEAVVQLVAAFVPLLEAVLPVLLPLIKALGSVITAIMPIILALVSIVVNNLASAITNILIPAVNLIVALFRGDFTGVMNAAKALVAGVGKFIVESFVNMKNGVMKAISGVIDAVKGLPGKAKAALGAIGSFLYNSGKALIQGFIDGIKAMAGTIGKAVSGVLGAAKKLFPHSPAKEGPFSGRGYTTYSGEALMQGFAEGIESFTPDLTRMLSSSLSQAKMVFNPVAGGSTLGDSTALRAPLAGPTNNAITVMIGNQVVDDHVVRIVDQNNQRRDRVAAQGVRR